MVVALGSPQPVFDTPSLAAIPDNEDDVAETGLAIVRNNSDNGALHFSLKIKGEVGPLHIPEIVFGAASFSGQYNSDEHLQSDVPVRTTRLALRYGIKAFDTSAYYGPSEIVLGSALKVLEPEFPRSSYQLMTKCGRYGPTKASFDYSPATIRASVERSLSRLNTTYLDTVYLHDVEFVCSQVQPREAGNHITSLTTEKAQYGLLEGEESKIWGEGDQKIIDALAELRKMKEQGLVKNLGITGYPLPVLLRIALLALHTPPYEPLDVLLSYSHLNIQNDTLAAFVPHFRDRARIKQIITASPLNMGLLTPSPPEWHPAPAPIREAAKEASRICETQKWEGGIPNLALGFAYRKARELDLSTVVGLSQLREVHENVKVWREMRSEDGEKAERRASLEKEVLKAFEGEPQGWSWAS